MINPEKAERLFVLGRPLSGAYSLFMRLRSNLYQKGIFKRKRLPCPVISIGNITLGGTGKTPHVMEISRFLKNRGLHPAVLTRGYRGKAGRGPLLVSDQTGMKTKASIAGDEPFMMASRLEGIPVIAGSDRYGCGLFALENLPVSIFILDDGFQHICLERDLDLVLVEANQPFGSGRLFPGGTLRESKESLSRADAVIITKCNEVPFNELELVEAAIRTHCKNKPLFRSFYDIQEVTLFNKDGSGPITWNLDPHAKCFCFCALARPHSFHRLLKGRGVNVSDFLSFPDHHLYSESDLALIGEKARRAGSDIALTTEKDFAKIPVDKWRAINKDIGLGIVGIKVDLPPSFYDFVMARIVPRVKSAQNHPTVLRQL